MKNIFIATAMSNLNIKDYASLRNSILKVKNNHPEYTIFSEITNIDDKNSFLSPEDGTRRDIEEIKKCDKFILVHLSSVQSSPLFELGMAFALNKEIDVFYFKEDDLPFMVKELDLISNNVKLIKINELKDLKIS